MTDDDGFKEVVLKDFNKRGLNGRMYKMDSQETLAAIEAFCQRGSMYGELGHPPLPPNMPYDKLIQRCMQIELEHAIILIKNPSFSKEEQVLRGWVKPVGDKHPLLMGEISAGKIRFGMRSITVPNTDFDGRYEISAIVTFDVIGYC